MGHQLFNRYILCYESALIVGAELYKAAPNVFVLIHCFFMRGACIEPLKFLFISPKIDKRMISFSLSFLVRAQHIAGFLVVPSRFGDGRMLSVIVILSYFNFVLGPHGSSTTP